jgi:Protein of unknown function (DUF3239)
MPPPPLPSQRPQAREVFDYPTAASRPARAHVVFRIWAKHYPLWPSILGVLVVIAFWHFCAYADQFSEDSHFAQLWSFVGFMVSLISFLIYRMVVQLHFNIGDTLPGKVIALNPVRVAVCTDLSTGEGSCPVLKIVKVPLKQVMGMPVEVGQNLVMVATYQRPISKNRWANFNPKPLEAATNDYVRIYELLNSIAQNEWMELLSAIHAIGTCKPGLYVRNNS